MRVVVTLSDKGREWTLCSHHIDRDAASLHDLQAIAVEITARMWRQMHAATPQPADRGAA